ncbi:hypothetical protein BDZ89DRAFT_737609 [Hymenopellis radicata]|nr:hypothetical protein BDZ89DRAFT_737609 [Hymenopellis radicata]
MPSGARKWFTLGSSALFFALFSLEAPFGRFSSPWIFTLDGKVSWMMMEIVSPICFSYSYFTSPLGGSTLSTRQNLLAAAYLTHYANRAVISPLMTPSRSRSDVIVLAAGVTFNVLNGCLIGSYLSSPDTQTFLSQRSSAIFIFGMLLWGLGFAGNIKHDMILMDIRRKSSEKKDSANNGGKEHYAIPHGLLFRWISFPNYLCEWFEWLGFALAASATPSFVPLSFADLLGVFHASASSFFPTLTPPWIFLFNEIVLMFPRALRAQIWYRKTFGDKFPKDRKIIIPFLL